jgi:hypothetical protein
LLAAFRGVNPSAEAIPASEKLTTPPDVLRPAVRASIIARLSPRSSCFPANAAFHAAGVGTYLYDQFGELPTGLNS